ncbi:MAG: DUF928 domain-containing protein [Cyanobacteria bacterium P01_B01_bin.77]
MKCIYVLMALVGGLSLSPPTSARIVSTELIQPQRISEMPEDLGYPRDGTRRGGGSRGGVCDLPPEVPPLTALMPDPAAWIAPEANSEVVDPATVLSFTNRPTPDLWFYLPYSLVETSRVTFTLKDAAGDTLKRARLDTTKTYPTTPSIIRVSLMELGLPLSPAIDYHWYLTVGCEGGPPIVVDGWVRYQPGEDNGQQSDNVRFLVDHLSLLAETRWLQPDDAAAQAGWQELLESVGLEDTAEAPLMDCCSFIEQIQN